MQIRRVGPGRSMASDNAFAVALLTLWHRVAESESSAQVAGQDGIVDRAALGAAVAPIVDDLRSGRTTALAATVNRDVIGFLALRAGTGWSAHTGTISLLLVHPERQRSGLGSELIRVALELAAESKLDRLAAFVPADSGLAALLQGLGFELGGRLPGWVRSGARTDDELVLILTL